PAPEDHLAAGPDRDGRFPAAQRRGGQGCPGAGGRGGDLAPRRRGPARGGPPPDPPPPPRPPPPEPRPGEGQPRQPPPPVGPPGYRPGHAQPAGGTGPACRR